MNLSQLSELPAHVLPALLLREILSFGSRMLSLGEKSFLWEGGEILSFGSGILSLGGEIFSFGSEMLSLGAEILSLASTNAPAWKQSPFRIILAELKQHNLRGIAC